MASSDDCSSGIHEFCNPCDCKCHGMVLTKNEVMALYKYFLTCGPISYEFHAPVHLIVDRIEQELGISKQIFKPLKVESVNADVQHKS